MGLVSTRVHTATAGTYVLVASSTPIEPEIASTTHDLGKLGDQYGKQFSYLARRAPVMLTWSSSGPPDQTWLGYLGRSMPVALVNSFSAVVSAIVLFPVSTVVIVATLAHLPRQFFSGIVEIGSYVGVTLVMGGKTRGRLGGGRSLPCSPIGSFTCRPNHCPSVPLHLKLAGNPNRRVHLHAQSPPTVSSPIPPTRHPPNVAPLHNTNQYTPIGSPPTAPSWSGLCTIYSARAVERVSCGIL